MLNEDSSRSELERATLIIKNLRAIIRMGQMGALGAVHLQMADKFLADRKLKDD